MNPSDNGLPFRRGSILLIGAIGIIAFAAMLVLGAYAPSLRSGDNGGPHALSNSAIGFSALVRLASDTGRHPSIIRSDRQFQSEDLLVVSPENGQAKLDPILTKRGGRATLIVLPKWRTQADPAHKGWITAGGLLPSFVTEGVLGPKWKVTISHHKSAREPLTLSGPVMSTGLDLVAPALAQTISGKDIVPILSDRQGQIILAQIGQRPLYVLADPDLLNNHGLGDRAHAAAALQLLDALNSTGAEGILFDVTANGLGRSRSPLRLAFDPPFLAVTITLVAAMLLAGWQMLVRFGAPVAAPRALPFGKSALVDNGAALIRRAGRETHLGTRYADLVGNRAAALFRLSPATDAGRREQMLDQLPGAQPFSSLAAEAASARSRPELVVAAQSLHDWIKELQE